MGTNKFTGRFLNYLNPLTGKMEKVPAPEYQHNATLSQQYRVIAKQNPDVAYTKQVNGGRMVNAFVDFPRL